MVRKRVVRVWKWVLERKVALFILFVFVVLPLWGFGELAEEVVEGEAFFFDEPILRAMQSLHSPFLDHAMIVISLFRAPAAKNIRAADIGERARH
jgi:undecaprenyl-diphosphatase